MMESRAPDVLLTYRLMKGAVCRGTDGIRRHYSWSMTYKMFPHIFHIEPGGRKFLSTNSCSIVPELGRPQTILLEMASTIRCSINSPTNSLN